jgi:hypothetical protein
VTAFVVLVGLAVCNVAFGQERLDGSLVVTADARDLEGLSLWRQTTDREAQPVTIRFTPGREPGSRTVTHECVAGEYFVRTATLVSLPFRVDIERCGSGRSVPLLRAAKVTGRIIVPKDSVATPVLSLVMRACAERARGEDQGQYRLRAAADGVFSTTVPAGCLYTTLRVPKLAPFPIPRLVLKPDQVHELGAITLKRGATLTVAVRSDDVSAGGAFVSVVSAEEYEAFLDRLFKKQPLQATVTALTDHDGSAYFIGIPPDLVYIVATKEDRKGFAGPLELHASEESIVDSVALSAGAAVSFEITGDRSWIPAGSELSVLGIPAMREVRFTNSTIVRVELPDAENGVHRVPIAGRWRFELHMGSNVILDQQEVDLPPDATTLVELSAVRLLFRGRVLVGDVPMAGTLSLRRQGSRERAAAEIQTDDEGRFTVSLPEPGQYSATFFTKQPGVRHARGSADFVQGRETTIRIPRTRVTGLVVFADGRPAPGAVVTIDHEAERILADPLLAADMLPIANADAAGAFAVQFLEPGVYEIRARYGDSKSEPQTVTVSETLSPSVRLVIPDDGSLTLRIVNARGEPVPGVMGIAFAAPTLAGAMPQQANVKTGPDGTSKIPLTWVLGAPLDFSLVASGYPVTAFRAMPGDDRTVSLTMPASGGQVRITVPRPAQSPYDVAEYGLGLYVVVNDQGGMLMLTWLTGMKTATLVMEPTSATIVIPSLASGNWRLAKFADLRAALLYFSGGPAPAVVQSFSVVPGGNVVVDIRQ